MVESTGAFSTPISAQLTVIRIGPLLLLARISLPVGSLPAETSAVLVMSPQKAAGTIASNEISIGFSPVGGRLGIAQARTGLVKMQPAGRVAFPPTTVQVQVSGGESGVGRVSLIVTSVAVPRPTFSIVRS